MSSRSGSISGVVVTLFVSFVTFTGGAAPARAARRGGPADGTPGLAGGAPVPVPEPLKPWVGWVLQGDAEEARCPRLDGQADAHVCAWPARLALALTAHGGTFSQDWEVWRAGLSELPGDSEHWPQDVRVDGKPAAVVGGETPAVQLEPGRHVVSGRFGWDGLPDALAAPPETGLLALTIGGRRVDFPLRDDQGRVFLGRKEAPAETDSVDVSVYRKLTDDDPLLLETRLQLAVSGKSRELVLGRALPAGFEAQAVDSALPLRFDPDGRLRLQVRPGNWTLTVTARRVQATAGVTRPQPGGTWKDGDEVWVFEARPRLRLVDVQGVQAIDPAQTTLPDGWKSLPAYAVPAGGTMTLAERRRGDGDAGRDQLQLTRQLWLDFDGGGYTVSDRISGQFATGWRLEAAPRTQLGRVAIDGRDQFITRLGPGSPDGVEIRNGRTEITADSRIEGNRGVVPAAGFAHDFDSLSATLAIPPGWRLLHASGADKITGTWVDGWSLLNFFLLLVTALAVQRLFGWRMGLLALAAVGLTVTEPDAPAAVWLAVLLGEALVRALRGGLLFTAARIYRVGAWIGLVVLLLPYAVTEVRRGVHPATEHEPSALAELASGSMFGADSAAPAERAARDSEQTRAGGVAKAEVPAAAAAPSLQGLIGVGGVGTAAGYSGSPGGKRYKKGDQPAPRAEGLNGLKNAAAPVAQNRDIYDPSVVVQTGPGLPHWGWETATLTFNGPVRPDQELHLYLVPPWLNLLLSLARVALLAALAFTILRRPLRLGGGWHTPRPLLGAAGALALLLGLGLPARAAAAEMPSPELLAELKQRLLKQPSCAPDCGAIARMTAEVSPGNLHLVLETSAAAPTAIPLPGGKAWSPTSVRARGKPASSLERADDGVLWLALPAGTTRVELEGPLPARDSVQVALPMRPRFVIAHARGWTIDGLHDDGAADESLKLSRQSGPTAGGEPDEPAAAPTLPPYLAVERTLHLGLRWEVDTRVRRVTPAGTPIVLDVPLLPGEAVTTPGIRVSKTSPAASVSFGPDDEQVTWHSTLAESPEIHLRADPATAHRWTESWRLDLGPTWHAAFSGIPSIHAADDTGARMPEWRPWPGEEVRIAMTRPAGAGGQSMTVDGATLELSPSLRSTHAVLTLDVRSSRGSQHTVTLGERVELESVTIDGTSQPLRLEGDGRRVVLPIAPGRQHIVLTWHEPAPLTTLFRAPAVDLGLPATNVEVAIHLTEAPRWVLWTAGPRLGPAVLFWSVILVVVLLSVALARGGLTPLRGWDWTLLGLGLAQLPLPASGFVALFLLGIGWRDRHRIADRPLLYDLTQLLFAGLAVASVMILFGAIEQGLVSQPDMRVLGNGSGAALLRWYQDRSGAVLPRPLMVSAPLMVYRGIMLAWSLWLALASLRWARWIWSAARAGGWWQPVRAKVLSPPPGPAAGAPEQSL